jgi:hypothetical protein
MLNLWRRLLCRLFGHKRCLEYLGGVVLECCERCEWVGRHAEYANWVAEIQGYKNGGDPT